MTDIEVFRERLPITLVVNGSTHEAEVEARVSLLDFLRDALRLTGTKKGCDRGECGACTVHVDTKPVNACMVLAAAAGGRAVTTIEGIARDGALHPVQQAFIDHDAMQCGFCTPGQIMSAIACIAGGHARTDPEIAECNCRRRRPARPT